MNTIYIADPQGKQVSYEKQEARRLWDEGAISRESLYWREGMTEWRPATEFFSSPLELGRDVSASRLIPSQTQRGFIKDPTRLTRLVVGLLWAYLGAGALGALITATSLATGQAGNADMDNLSALDIVGLVVALPQMLIVLVSGVVFLMWIHRANRNARGLGAQGMTFSPGWSVGWYFIPIANLWKPYQAMKQIWQASADPVSWRTQTPPALLSNWWGLWIVSNILSNMSFRMSLRADTSSEMVASEIVTLISDLLDIPLCLIAIRLVRQIIHLQSHWAAQTMQSQCAICHQPMASSEMIFLNHTWVCARCKPILVQQMQEGLAG